MEHQKVARLVDHTLLKPEATPEQIRVLCREAQEYGFYAVCLNPWYVPLAVKELSGSGVNVATVVGFPLGATTSAVKAAEAEEAVRSGAREVDMVMNFGALKAREWEKVIADIRQVVAKVSEQALVKVIIETGLLTEDEKIEACRSALAAGADYVKTSTGYGPGGATPEDVRLMRITVGPQVGVKASGGIRGLTALEAMVKAGATRIGTSSGVKIMKELDPSY